MEYSFPGSVCKDGRGYHFLSFFFAFFPVKFLFYSLKKIACVFDWIDSTITTTVTTTTQPLLSLKCFTSLHFLFFFPSLSACSCSGMVFQNLKTLFNFDHFLKKNFFFKYLWEIKYRKICTHLNKNKLFKKMPK